MAFKLLPEEKTSSKFNMQEALGTATRVPGQVVAAGGALLAGAPGSILSGIHELAARPITKAITGEDIPYEKSPIGKILPTTQEHLRRIQERFPSTKPQNRVENFIQNTVVDTGELFLPGKYLKMGKYALSPMRALGISTAANTAGEGVYQFSGDESKGDMTRRGSMLALSLMNPTSAKDISKNLYAQASQQLPKGATGNASSLVNSLNSLENKILKSRPVGNLSSSEKFVYDQIQNFRNLVKNNQIDIDQLTAQKRSFGQELNKHVFELTDRTAKKGIKSLSLEILDGVKKTMKDYGRQNPQWYKFQSAADQAHGAIEQSSYISRFLNKYLKGRPETLSHLFGGGALAGVSHLAGGLPAAITSGAYLGAKVTSQMIKSPELRKHWSKVIGAAAAENPKLLNSSLDEMQEAMEKDKKTKFRLLP